MAKVLISGGAGFIGSAIARKLSLKQHQVCLLDNLLDKVHGKTSPSEKAKMYKDFAELHVGDVRSMDDWHKILPGTEVLVHLASETGTGQSMYQEEHYADVNINGTKQMIKAIDSMKSKPSLIILASSRAVYGEGKYRCKQHGDQYPVGRGLKALEKGVFAPLCPACNEVLYPQATDENSKLQPVSIYGETKLGQEKLLMEYCKGQKIGLVIFRMQNVYGPGQSLINPYTGILSIFAGRMLEGGKINIFEDGQMLRDMVYIDDVADIYLKAIESPPEGTKILNIGLGKPIAVIDIAKMIREKLRSASQIELSGDFRIGDVRHNYADITLLNKLLNTGPQVSFAQGLDSFMEWLLLQRPVKSDYENSLYEMKKTGHFRSSKK